MDYELRYYDVSGRQVHSENVGSLSLADVKRHAYEVVCGMRSSYDIKTVTLYDGTDTDSINI